MPTMDYNLLKKSDPNAVDIGESTFSRESLVSTAAAVTQGRIMFSFFTADKNETISQVRVITQGAAAATPTLIRIGIYSVDAATGQLDLVASTPNDVTLLAAADTPYTKALSVPFSKNKGQRYGVGLIVVSAFGSPTLWGKVYPSPASETFVNPKLCAALTGQTDLVTPITDASLSATSINPYFVLLP